MNNPMIIQMVKIRFKGRDEIISIEEAQALNAGLVNALCANAVESNAIKTAVGAAFGVRRDELEADTRRVHIAFARQVAMWMHRVTTDMSLNEIGAKFPRATGKPRDHGTVLHAYHVVENIMSVDSEVRAKIMSVHSLLTKNHENTNTRTRITLRKPADLRRGRDQGSCRARTAGA